MKFITCDGEWSVGPNENLICTGSLVSVPSSELQQPGGAGLTWDDVSQLQGEVLTLFAVVFGFLVLKKVL